MLASKNPFRGDGDITFDEGSHTYRVRGKKVPISVTALGAKAVPPEHRFDGRKIIAKNLTAWRENASNKYHALVVDVDDEQATKNVMDSWSANRNLGTGMHKCFEQFLNGEFVAKADEYAVEMDQFHAAMAKLPDLTPARTEMSIYANDARGDPAVAGQIDLLMKDAEGGLHIVDFKRTPGDLAPEASCYGKRFLNDLPLNDHHKYSLQLQLYAIMLELQTGEPVRSMRLMQVHPDLDEARLIETTDMRAHAMDLLRGEGVPV
jgi:hypothetical protein